MDRAPHQPTSYPYMSRPLSQLTSFPCVGGTPCQPTKYPRVVRLLINRPIILVWLDPLFNGPVILVWIELLVSRLVTLV